MSGAISGAVLVLIDNSLDRRGFDEWALLGLSIEQRVAHPIAQLIAKPGADRGGKAALRAVEDLGGQAPPVGGAQQSFLSAAVDLEPSREGGRELHHLMVEQW